MSRQIKDIKDKNTGQLVYPRTHAKATYMSDGTTVEDAFNSIDQIVEDALNNKGSEVIKFTNMTASNWILDSTYSSFPYRCDITCANVTSEDYAEVVFEVTQAASGNYAPVCETGSGIVSIWSSVQDAITIPVIIITK